MIPRSKHYIPLAKVVGAKATSRGTYRSKHVSELLTTWAEAWHIYIRTFIHTMPYIHIVHKYIHTQQGAPCAFCPPQPRAVSMSEPAEPRSFVWWHRPRTPHAILGVTCARTRTVHVVQNKTSLRHEGTWQMLPASTKHFLRESYFSRI